MNLLCAWADSCSPLNIFANPTKDKLMQRLENVDAHNYYTHLIANKQRASITCGYAGQHKGKAIYATDAFEPGDRIWSEFPFVAMQHQENKPNIQCCALCFIPLVDARVEWERAHNSAEASIAFADTNHDSLATFSELEKTIEYVRGVKVRNSEEILKHDFLTALDNAVVCEQCGEVYCSNNCQTIAYWEYHSLCCSYSLRNDSAMGRFKEHSIAINEIFLLAAKVVANVVLLYLKHSDLEKARFAVDQFHKLDWWDVVVSEEDVRDSGQTMEEYKASFRDLISQTFACFQAGLEENLETLFRVEREQYSSITSVDEVCSACEDILNVDFFAKIVGMFEMNSISMEIDHPLQALNAELQEMSNLENEAKNRVARTLELASASTSSTSSSSEERSLREENFCLDKKPLPGPFIGVEGTALFSLICTMNHSCLPNCIVVYGHNGEAHVHAIQAIQPKDELCIEYIDTDRSYDERQYELREYHFRCQCMKCMREECAGDSE
uniref:Uncharacterized protein AlNc14C196G8570 n=1 Tax=Albugo laibachii Nc14 TaxID=890382 RepID=F0WQ89_9STRA|nr:conserved hypothetical protein [Albugo laibachii Nc14]|eukprot:CCA23495.1 conserved hypothetical protein [Albugo laibachii Nc14]